MEGEFWGLPSRGTADDAGVGRAGGVLQGREAEVAEYDGWIGLSGVQGQKHVIGFDISVNDLVPALVWFLVRSQGVQETGVQVGAGGGELDEHMPEEAFGDAADAAGYAVEADEVEEIAAVAVGHPELLFR